MIRHIGTYSECHILSYLLCLIIHRKAAKLFPVISVFRSNIKISAAVNSCIVSSGFCKELSSLFFLTQTDVRSLIGMQMMV